jgi:hypothetical protein
MAVDAGGYLVVAVLGLALGLVVLFLTFWLAYAILYLSERGVSALSELALGHRLRLTHDWRLMLSGTLIVALFIEWCRRSPGDLGDYSSFERIPYGNALAFQAGPIGALAILLARPRASAAMITEMLYTGPRLVLGAWQLTREGLRLSRADCAACAWVLGYLANYDRAVSPEELVEAWPEMDWGRLRRELRWIPGVVFLDTKLSLTDDLRRELRVVAAEGG